MVRNGFLEVWEKNACAGAYLRKQKKNKHKTQKNKTKSRLSSPFLVWPNKDSWLKPVLVLTFFVPTFVLALFFLSSFKILDLLKSKSTTHFCFFSKFLFHSFVSFFLFGFDSILKNKSEENDNEDEPFLYIYLSSFHFT